MKLKKRIYVAGPYTKPDPCINTFNAIQAANELMDLGFAPFIPHLSHFWHTVTPKPYEEWMEYDAQFLGCCDAVLRLPGESSGADREIGQAMQLGIPVFRTVEELAMHFGL